MFLEYLKSLADPLFCCSHLIQMHAKFTGRIWLLIFHLLLCSFRKDVIMHTCKSLIFIVLSSSDVISQDETEKSNKVGVLV